MEYVAHTLVTSVQVNSIVNARRLFWQKDDQFLGERHSCWELQYVAHGNLYIHLGNRFYKLRQGELILFRPDMFHVVYGDSEFPAELWVISFGGAGAALEQAGHGIFSATARFESLLRGILEMAQTGFEQSSRTDDAQLLRRRPDASAGCDQLLRGKLEEAVILLSQAVEAPTSYAGYLGMKTLQNQDFLAERIRTYMMAQVRGQMNLAQVAGQFHISESLVKTVYKERFGVSLIADYHRQKIALAKVLLCQDGQSVSQVAQELGFETVYYFSNFFKKHTGCAPSHYQRQRD